MLKYLNIGFLERYLLHLNVLLFMLIIRCHSAIDISSNGYSLHTQLPENFIPYNNSNNNNATKITQPNNNFINDSIKNHYHQNEAPHGNLYSVVEPSYVNETRDRRQVLYNSPLHYLTNFNTEGALCRLPDGVEGVCLPFEKCSSYQNNQQMQEIQPQHSQRQQKLFPHTASQSRICIYFDQFLRANLGFCCTDHQQSENQSNESTNSFPTAVEKPHSVVECNTTTTNIEADPNSPTANEMPKQNSTVNDPIKDDDFQGEVKFNGSLSRYPWPESPQFIDFNQPDFLPPASFPNWPMPLPTFPSNQYFPSFPINGVVPQEEIPTVTNRPSYPQYPQFPQFPQFPFYPQFPAFSTQRPPFAQFTSTIATTVGTTRRPIIEEPNLPPASLPTICGIRSVISPDQERIVGGSNAIPFEFPWIAVLFRNGKQFCGGSLITNNHILTAAHCVARMTSWDVAGIVAHLGDYNIRTEHEVTHVTRRIQRLVRHRGFDFRRLHSDIAILTLNKPVVFNYQIQPICLPTSPTLRERTFIGKLATVAGWGSLRENGVQPGILQKVQVPIWSNSKCARQYGPAAPGGITPGMICAGQAAKDSCSGDSGGPMVVNEGGRFIQVGIVSWGIGCGKGQYPGVYTRITALLPWIYKNIK